MTFLKNDVTIFGYNQIITQNNVAHNKKIDKMERNWISDKDVQELDILSFTQKVKEVIREKSDDLFGEEKRQIRLCLIKLLAENRKNIVIEVKKEMAKKVNTLMAMKN